MKKELSATETEILLKTLQARFEKNMHRHQNITWEEVAQKLKDNHPKLATLHQMEETGGEPDVVGKDEKTNQIVFFDCAAESPKGRRSLCYDGTALAARKENKPKSSAVDMAQAMGIKLLDETQYLALQALQKCDTKTSSWIETPAPIRKLGGAVFCDFRYGTVFLYHNGAESYYGSRGFRGSLSV